MTPLPAPPNAANYPAHPTLDLFPVDPTTTATMDDTRGYKDWQAPAGYIPEGWTSVPASDDDIILHYMDNTAKVRPFVMTYGEMLAPRNVAPASATPQQIAIWQALPYGQQSRPVPIRQLIAGVETPTVGPFGMITIANSSFAPAVPQTPAETTDSATLQRILTAEEEILAKDGLPPV